MNLVKAVLITAVQRLLSTLGYKTSELRYAAEVSIWVRWLFLVACVIEANYRVEYRAVSHIVNTTYFCGMMVPNAYVLWRIRSHGTVDLRLAVRSQRDRRRDAHGVYGNLRGIRQPLLRHVLLRACSFRLGVHLSVPGLRMDHTCSRRLRGRVPGGGRRPGLRAYGREGDVL